jgi:hypothetical protein
VKDNTPHGEKEINKFTAIKVSRKWPVVILVKTGLTVGKVFGSREREMKIGANGEDKQGLTALEQNFIV